MMLFISIFLLICSCVIAAPAEEASKLPFGAVPLANGREIAFEPEIGDDMCFDFRFGDTNSLAGNSIQFVSHEGIYSVLPVLVGGKIDSASRGDCLLIPCRGEATFNKPFHIRLHPRALNWTTNEVWVNENYTGKMTLDIIPEKVKAELASNVSLCMHPVRDEMNIFSDTPYLPLNVDGLNKSSSTAPALGGMPHFLKIPYLIARPSRVLDLSCCIEGLFMHGTPFYCDTNSMCFAVPVARYIRVHALCIASPQAPEGSEPIVTATILKPPLSHFDSATALSCCTRIIPAKGASLPAGVTVFCEAEDGTPIYQVAFDIEDDASLRDIRSNSDGEFLMLEFTGFPRTGNKISRKSSVQIYAVTLEKAQSKKAVVPDKEDDSL